MEDSAGNLGFHRHVVLDQGVYHVRPDLQMLTGIVDIVGQMPGLGVPESRLEIALDKVMDSRPLVNEFLVLAVFLLHLEGDADRVIPEGIRFDLVTGPLGHGIAVDVGVHPSQGPMVHLCPEQAVGLHHDLCPAAGKVTLENALHRASVFLPNRLGIGATNDDVLLQNPCEPQRRLHLGGLAEQPFLLVCDQVVQDFLEGSLVTSGKQRKTRKSHDGLPE